MILLHWKTSPANELLVEVLLRIFMTEIILVVLLELEVGISLNLTETIKQPPICRSGQSVKADDRSRASR